MDVEGKEHPSPEPCLLQLAARLYYLIPHFYGYPHT